MKKIYLVVTVLLGVLSCLTLSAQRESSKYFVKNGIKQINPNSVENLKQYTDFSNRDLEHLLQNGFLIVPFPTEDPRTVYSENNAENAPSFITTDLASRAYIDLINAIKADVDQRFLRPKIRRLDSLLYERFSGEQRRNKEPALSGAYAKLTAYFAVACELGRVNVKINKSTIADELKKINFGETADESSITSSRIDYSAFRRIADQSASSDENSYAKTVLWHRSAKFSLESQDDIYASVLLSLTLFDPKSKDIKDLYDEITAAAGFFEGTPEGYSTGACYLCTKVAFGCVPEKTKLAEKTKLSALKDALKKSYEKTSKEKADPVFTFFTGYKNPEYAIFSELTDNEHRKTPRMLDVAAVSGSLRAKTILFDIYKEAENWPTYERKLKECVVALSKQSEIEKKSSLRSYNLISFETLYQKNYSETYPFMAENPSWELKSLNTFSAALAEYSSLDRRLQIAIEPRNFEAEPKDIAFGYVEQNPAFYKKISSALDFIKTELKNKKILSKFADVAINKFAGLIMFCDTVSNKEFAGIPLNQREFLTIAGLGINFFGPATELLIADRGDTSDTSPSFDIALSSVYETAINDIKVTFATGNPAQIFALVESPGGKFYLTRGITATYYEFSAPAPGISTWRDNLKNANVPSLQSFMTDLYSDGKAVPLIREYKEYIKFNPSAKKKQRIK